MQTQFKRAGNQTFLRLTAIPGSCAETLCFAERMSAMKQVLLMHRAVGLAMFVRTATLRNGVRMSTAGQKTTLCMIHIKSCQSSLLCSAHCPWAAPHVSAQHCDLLALRLFTDLPTACCAWPRRLQAVHVPFIGQVGTASLIAHEATAAYLAAAVHV